jgi:hypothetical protein
MHSRPQHLVDKHDHGQLACHVGRWHASTARGCTHTHTHPVRHIGRASTWCCRSMCTSTTPGCCWRFVMPAMGHAAVVRTRDVAKRRQVRTSAAAGATSGTSRSVLQ